MRIALCLAAASTLLAAPLQKGERDRALSELHASRKQFLDAIDGLSAAQWAFKPGETAWSIAECAEHIALSEDLILGMVREKLLKVPLAAAKPEGTVSDEQVLKMAADRGKKGKAPEPLQPKRTWTTRDEVTAAFKARRDGTLDYVRTTADELRDRYSKHPFGQLDAYQWILLLSAHTDRHVQQILEVKAAPGFPAR